MCDSAGCEYPYEGRRVGSIAEGRLFDTDYFFFLYISSKLVFHYFLFLITFFYPKGVQLLCDGCPLL